MRQLVLLLVLVLAVVAAAACDSGGGDDGSAADAPPPAIDAAGLCGLYEQCTDTVTGTDCASGVCRVFNMLGGNGCTQACDSLNPCPDDTVGPVSCNMMGVCRPTVLAACTP